MILIHQINDFKHDVKLVSQIMKCCDYYSTFVPCSMLGQHHMAISCYYLPKVTRMNGIFLLPNFEWLKLHFWNFNNCVKTNQVVISTIVAKR
jgi:hypothetical protein